MRFACELVVPNTVISLGSGTPPRKGNEHLKAD